MEMLHAIFSAVLGFALGLISSYIFWYKQRRLDRPRLEFNLEEAGATPSENVFSVRNKGGSFAERVEYSYGDLDEDEFEHGPVYLDTALASDERQRIRLELEEDQDVLIQFTYTDVFGGAYKDSWELHFKPAGDDPYYLVIRNDS